jgi:hypothetical protein
MADSGSGELSPKGEALKRALRWLDDAVRDDPGRDRSRLVSEAATRFDLTPLDEDFLLRSWVRPK